MKKIIPLQSNANLQNTKEDLSDEETREVQEYSSLKESFHQIERNALIEGNEINFSLYLQKGLKFKKVLEASDKSPAKIPPEISNSIGDIVIKSADIPLYDAYLESLETALLPGKESARLKALLIKEKSKIVMRKILADPRSGKNIKNAETVVEKIVSSILDNRDSLYNLISIKNFDYYTYTHSVNVAVLSIGLGISLGLAQEKILHLGLGALLHDLGKSSIPPEILNKPEKLTPFEFEIMKSHVIYGEKILREHRTFPQNAFDAITQHHEKLSGSGYPYSLKASDIRLYGRITAIADCYDALTTQRPYKNAFTPFQALDIIVKQKEHYDNELLIIFIKMLGKLDDESL